MSPDTVLLIVLLLIGAEYALNQIAERLNLSWLKPQPPESLVDVYETDEYARSQEYLKTTTRFGNIRTTFSSGLTSRRELPLQ